MTDATSANEAGRSAVVPIVLAAGASSRMGTPKSGLELAGRTALRWVLDACAVARLGTAVVVTGAHPEAARAAASGARVPPRFVANADWARGRTTSIRVGLAALSGTARAFLLWPVDVPLAAESGALEQLLSAREADSKRAAPRIRGWVPSFDNRRGHPILLERSVAVELSALGDDVPARDLVRALASRGELAHVLARDPAVLWDMDTPSDHARLVHELERRASEARS